MKIKLPEHVWRIDFHLYCCEVCENRFGKEDINNHEHADYEPNTIELPAERLAILGEGNYPFRKRIIRLGV